jgi:hypothetical protein
MLASSCGLAIEAVVPAESAALLLGHLESHSKMKITSSSRAKTVVGSTTSRRANNVLSVDDIGSESRADITDAGCFIGREV